MANQTGRPIAPARKLVAAVMGTLAGFVIVYGLGMKSWPVSIFGLVVLAIAVTLAVVTPGRRGGRATVAGTAEIMDITAPPLAGAYGRAEIRAIVVAPGLGTFDKVIRDGRVPVAKWPVAGSTVPITVDVDDTRRVRVNWKDAPDLGPAGDPPPPVTGSAHSEFHEDPLLPEEEDDDVLGAVAPKPWETRDDDWAAQEPAYEEERATTPVVVRDTPNGPILEGQLVGGEEQVAPLPRRAGSGPRRSGGSFDSAATDPVGFDPLPTDPATPDDPANGEDPATREDPAAPASPAAPTGPVAPTGPAAPASPAALEDPAVPAGPAAPASPAAPHRPGAIRRRVVDRCRRGIAGLRHRGGAGGRRDRPAALFGNGIRPVRVRRRSGPGPDRRRQRLQPVRVGRLLRGLAVGQLPAPARTRGRRPPARRRRLVRLPAPAPAGRHPGR
ncbi:Collagen alpha-4(VI) chain [Actinoplanes sp. SE50/110]|uniref:hypothetical protein n=1 Tax=Actinoplanes sp. (strain ATCC 31044 / CBS 674.73 / SE50/110) TaxID=134676 RepID=UPI00023ED571|nr:hypothetical protein [Actinoplanes sp. SE50/110]AEV82261.1 Collagen alpha-4(VI) chain [Actinoplanes sp. SE50/110]